MTKAFDPIDVAFGTAVRNARRSAGVSQSGLAEKLGVTFQQVQKYERGANRVSISTAVRIAEALRTSVSALLPRDNAPPPKPPCARALRLQGLASRLPGHQQDALEAFLEGVINDARASNPQSRDVHTSLTH